MIVTAGVHVITRPRALAIIARPVVAKQHNRQHPIQKLIYVDYVDRLAAVAVRPTNITLFGGNRDRGHGSDQSNAQSHGAQFGHA
jgi:hypothetical protein